MEKVCITVSHTPSEVIGFQSFVRVLVIFLAIFSSYASCENPADESQSGSFIKYDGSEIPW